MDQMYSAKKQLMIKAPDPFDGSAHVRLKHMGLLDKECRVRTQAMTAFSSIFTGLFFDDLCDYGNPGDMLTIYETFKTLSKKGDYQHMYLLLSILYDYMRKPLPDPVWWLAGNSEAVTAFMATFIKGYESLMKSEGILKPGGEVMPG